MRIDKLIFTYINPLRGDKVCNEKGKKRKAVRVWETLQLLLTATMEWS
jgi:hypothetical protein